MGDEQPLTLRDSLEALLRGGLETEWRNRAYSDAEIEAVTRALRELAPGDHKGRLRVAGFTVEPYAGNAAGDLEESCRTCMYFSRHRCFCALPVLKLPVKPEWSCRLWRI